MPSTTRSMKGSASSSSSSSSNDAGNSNGKKRGLFAPSPPSKRTQQQLQAADEDEREEESNAVVDSASQPASAARKLSPPSRQATLYSVKLGAAGRLQRAERKGVAAAGAGAGEGGGKRTKVDDAEAETEPSGSSTDVSGSSGSSGSTGKAKAEDVGDELALLPRSRSRSPTPRHPTDFKQVTSPRFLSTCYTPFPGCHYLSSFLPTIPQNDAHATLSRWYTSLSSLPNWYNPTLHVYGREIVQSRPIAAFSKVQGLQLRYSGQDAKMDPWPEVLREMEDMVRDRVGREVRFNHAFLNWYADGRVGIGRHSDNLENRVIITLSLGAPRKWIMTRRPPRGATAAAKKAGTKLPPAERKAWTLENGSLLVMQGNVQSEWYHEVPKEVKVKEGRISVTFRQLVYD